MTSTQNHKGSKKDKGKNCVKPDAIASEFQRHKYRQLKNWFKATKAQGHKTTPTHKGIRRHKGARAQRKRAEIYRSDGTPGKYEVAVPTQTHSILI